jgi:antirestriction protein ArdC
MPAVDAFIAATGAVIRHGGGRACYIPATDEIRMPERAAFTGSATSSAEESYYATLLHELTHWTGPVHRCGRDLSGRFGSDAYAMEELIAELGSAFLCGELGIAAVPRSDHAQYLAHWLAVLKADKRAIFTAASKASEAIGFLVNRSS